MDPGTLDNPSIGVTHLLDAIKLKTAVGSEPGHSATPKHRISWYQVKEQLFLLTPNRRIT